MKAVVFTLGCKVNEVESSGLMASLEEAGYEVSDKLGYADLYILNTCAVTREAEKKSRQLVARAKKYNPNAKIFVCGCASEKNAAQFSKCGATGVFGARDKLEALQAAAREFSISCGRVVYPKRTKTRAFIKVQDGCDNFCSYCIIPYLRGREVSRKTQDILAEIENCGAYEVVLTGINLSAFDKRGEGLEGLLRALSGVKKRIRLGSLECGVISDGFLRAAGGLYDFAPQFHLSLQSGSTAVLKSMARHYTRDEFLQKCKDIYSVFPDAAITTDIIAGFPTETEEDFSQSLSIIEEAGFARVHAFAYSPREGTAAFKLKDLPAEVKKERLSRLIEEGKKAESRYISRHLGATLSIVAEDFDGEYTCGYTGNYIKTFVKGKLTEGGLYSVKIIGQCKDGALAVPSEM